MHRAVRLLPSFLVIGLLVLVLRSEPAQTEHARLAATCAFGPCQSAPGTDSRSAPDASILQPIDPGCILREIEVETLPPTAPIPNELRIEYVDEFFFPRSDTYPLSVTTATLTPGLPNVELDPGRPLLPFAPLDVSPVTMTAGLGMRFEWTDPSLMEGFLVDPSAASAPEARDLMAGGAPAGFSLGHTACRAVDPQLPQPQSLSGWVTVTSEFVAPTPGELIVSYLPVTTATLVYVDIAVKNHPQQGPIQVELIDPGLFSEPPSVATATASLGNLELNPPQAPTPLWIPTLPLEPLPDLQPTQEYWFQFRVLPGWEFGTDASQAGAAHPSRVWFRDSDGAVTELPADLAHHVVGTVNDAPTDVGGIADAGGALQLHAWPNPFVAGTRVAWRAARRTAGRTAVEVFDVRGKRVRRLEASIDSFGGEDTAGSADTARLTSFWDGRDSSGQRLPHGTYLVRVRTADGREGTHKVTLTK